MKINLDINRSEPILETINLRQGDGGLRTIDIQITENNQPIAITGYTLQFEANLPSGSMVQHAGVIKDATAGLFSYTFTTADTSEAGQLPVAYFRLYDRAKNSVATRNIRIVVDRAADITQSQANDYLGGIDTLTAEAKAKLESNNQQIAAQQTQLDSIKANGIIVGGRNLIMNSNIPQVYIRPDQNPNSPHWTGRPIYKGLKSNETYTFSALAIVETADKTAEQWGIRIFQESGNHQALARVLAANTGKRQSFTFTIPDDGISYDVWIYAGVMGQHYTPVDLKVTLTMTEYQLERGNVATDYSLAPEDYLNRIAALEQIVLNQ